jgi:hypothetical protein
VSEIALRADNTPAIYSEDPTGGRLVSWAKAAVAANQLAASLSKTSFVPAAFKGNEYDATAAIIMGDELGLSPLAALRSIYVVHGTPAMYARTMVALALSHGHQVWTEKSTDAEVVVCGQRKGSTQVERSSWTISRAQKAGYTSNKKYSSNAQEMLYSKAAAEVARKIAADVLAGVPYSVEDLELEDQPTTTVSRDTPAKATVRRKPAPAPVPAEPEFDAEPESEPELLPGDVHMITDAQLKMLHASFNDKGYKDRDDRLNFVALTLDIEVASSKDLTKDQASRVIDALQQLSDVPQ